MSLLNLSYLFVVVFIDTDECKDSMICGGVSQCVNLPGSYSCQCGSGMDFDPNSMSCIGWYCNT